MTLLSKFFTPDEVTVHFYESLNDKNFGAAFDCLTDEIKEKRWNNDLNKFASGYEYTLAIDTITCTMLQASDDTAICIVDYRDEKSILCHPLLDNLAASQDQEADIVEFKEFMVNDLGADPEKTAAIPNTEALKPNAVELLTWLGDADREKIKIHLTNFKKSEAMTSRKVTCVSNGQGWQIDAIGLV